MNKVSAAARALAVILAIASAFASIPLAVPLLLLFGGIAAVGNTPDRNSKNYMMTLVLLLGASTLSAVPYVGSYLATVFESLGAAFVGASIVAITITLEYRITRDWFKAAP
jgi:hypothetical protein